MSCDSELATQIVQDGIVKMIGPLLVDGNVLIRAGSASALRHIADNVIVEAHEGLMKDDIMTPLCYLLKTVSWKLPSYIVTRFIYAFSIYSIIWIGNQH